jgi:histone-binding protein RBBP4
MASEVKAPAPTEHLRALYHSVANWRKHAENLYSFAQTQMLEWPALSLDWLPDRKNIEAGRDYSLQYIAVGTQALPGSQNYVAVLEFALPLDKDDAEDFYSYDRDEDKEAAQHNEPNPFVFRSVKGHSRLAQLVYVDGMVLKLRAMPQQTDTVAVKTSSGFVSIINLANRPAGDSAESPNVAPDVRLKGHRIAGFGLDWNPSRAGVVASGSDDQQVILWDIEDHTDDMGTQEFRQRNNGTAEVNPLLTLIGHTDTVHEVSWHKSQEHILASCSEDKSCRLWDTRSKNNAIILEQAHRGTVFGVSMHPTAAFMFATCGGDRLIKLWDMRRTNAPTHTMFYHSNAITHVSWAPFSDSVLATASADRRLVLWDIAKIGQPAQGDGDHDAPPELSFVHTGHLSRITDLAWNPSLEDEWMVASADMTNLLQLYRPNMEVVYDYMNPEDFDVDTGEA